MSSPTETAAAMYTRWTAKIATAGIFTVVGWLPKFTGNAGPLVERLPGGEPAVLTIAAIELVIVVLLFIPRKGLYASALAVLSMLGAIASHLGPVGFDGDFMGVFIMALVALATSTTATVLEWRILQSPTPAAA
ncbi:MAG: hypothetical protein Phyf2KO_20350 [Phycisphaerales bacterium]